MLWGPGKSGRLGNLKQFDDKSVYETNKAVAWEVRSYLECNYIYKRCNYKYMRCKYIYKRLTVEDRVRVTGEIELARPGETRVELNWPRILVFWAK